MTLNITEVQKEVIESQGFMVVEFKLWYRKLGEMLLEYAQRIIDTRKAIVLFLQDKMLKAFESLANLAERISQELESCFKLYDYNLCEERQKYPFIRSIGKEYRPNLNNKIVYHRCRDRC